MSVWEFLDRSPVVDLMIMVGFLTAVEILVASWFKVREGWE